MTAAYDFIIVGGGSAGAVLANRLSADPANRVLVLEAGRPDHRWDFRIHMPAALSYPLTSTFYNWGYQSDPEPYMQHRRIAQPRGKVLGGSSCINGMIWIRGNALDYERWGGIPGLEQWDYAHCLPYFKRVETRLIGGDTYRGSTGPLKLTTPACANPLFDAFFRSVQEAGYALTDDVNGYGQEGFGRFDQTIFRGRRLNAARAYLPPVLRRPNLTLKTKAFVHRILLEGPRAVGVEYRHRGRAEVVRGREILCCGGAINSPQLLQLSGIGDPADLEAAGVPDGVFNVVQGPGSTGELLTHHPGIAKVSLTGEVGTGKRVMAAAAQTLKHVTMELGGKSPLIIFGDADLENAVSGALLANFYTQGEICSNGTRVYVADSLYDSFLTRLETRVRAMRIGDPLDPDTQVGALISREHTERVLGYIDRAKTAGARLVCGGGRPSNPGLAGGNFVEPTVFADCRDDMELVREEVFGPVMAVLRFADDDAEATVIARANDTPFGLAAGIFTRDLQRAHRVAAQLEAGVCWVNTYNVTPVEVPFGGYKQSGIGRENGRITIEHYTQLKTVYVALGDIDAPY